MPKVPEQEDRGRKFGPEKALKKPPHPKEADKKGENIEQNTRNRGYQQDR